MGYGTCHYHGGRMITHRKSAALARTRDEMNSAAQSVPNASAVDLMRATLGWQQGQLNFLTKLAQRITDIDTPEAYALMKLLGEERERASVVAERAARMQLDARLEDRQREAWALVVAVIKRLTERLDLPGERVAAATRSIQAELLNEATAVSNGGAANRAEVIEGTAVDPLREAGRRFDRRQAQAEELGIWPKDDKERANEHEMLRDLGFDEESERWDEFVKAERNRRRSITALTGANNKFKKVKGSGRGPAGKPGDPHKGSAKPRHEWAAELIAAWEQEKARA